MGKGGEGTAGPPSGFITHSPEASPRQPPLMLSSRRERVISTAEKYRVQLACHPDDPPAPVLRGVERWDWPVFEVSAPTPSRTHTHNSAPAVPSPAAGGIADSVGCKASSVSVQGFKRFCGLVDSPYHGLNLCCGTASEGMDDPATELIPMVKYFAERNKIFNIHFRNISECSKGS